MANRIQAGIDRINEKMKEVPAEKLASLNEGLKTNWAELVQYQKLQSTAFACGKLTLEEAQTLYRIYGGEVPSPDKWDALDLAEKVIGTQTGDELTKIRLCDVL